MGGERQLAPFYLRSLSPAAALVLVCYFLGMRAEHLVGFALGYVWIVAFYTPGLKEKISDHKYRFSFLRFAFFLQDKAFANLAVIPEQMRAAAARVIVPILFTGILYLVLGGVNPLVVFVGAVSFEGLVLLYAKLGRSVV
jgi:hypothetical protein